MEKFILKKIMRNKKEKYDAGIIKSLNNKT